MNKLFIIFFIAVFFYVDAQALTRHFQISGNFQTMKVDDNGQIFLLDRNRLHLYNDQGLNIATRNFSEGRPLSIEFGRSNEVYFYMEGGTEIRVTDRNLANRRSVSLKTAGIENPGPACLGDNQQLWVYDRDREKFLLLDHNMEVRRKSESLRNHAFHTLNPLTVSYYGNKLFVNNDGHEVLVFNRFGSFENRLDVKSDGYLQIANDRLYYVRNGRPMVMNIESGRSEAPPMALPQSNIMEYLIKDGRLYLLSRGGLTVYKI